MPNWRPLLQLRQLVLESWYLTYSLCSKWKWSDLFIFSKFNPFFFRTFMPLSSDLVIFYPDNYVDADTAKECLLRPWNFEFCMWYCHSKIRKHFFFFSLTVCQCSKTYLFLGYGLHLESYGWGHSFFSLTHLSSLLEFALNG